MARCLKISLSWLLLARGLDMDYGAPSHPPEKKRLQAFDCDAGLSEWRIVWSQEKKRWCCDHKDRGCPPPLAGAAPPMSSNLRGGEKPVVVDTNAAFGLPWSYLSQPQEKDDSLMDPANFPDVKAVAAELDKLRAEYKRPSLTTDHTPSSEEYEAYNRGISEGKLGEYVMKYLEKHPGQVNGISKKVLDDVHKMLQEQFHDFHKQTVMAGGHPMDSVILPEGAADAEPHKRVSGLLLVMLGAMAGLTCSAVLCMGMACGMWWSKKLQAVPTQDPLLRTDAENAGEPRGIQGEEQSMVASEEAE